MPPPDAGRDPLPGRQRHEVAGHACHFLPWYRVYAFFRRWRNHDRGREFYDRLRRLVRERAGRDSEPGAGVIDSQSVKADAVVGSDSRGFDGDRAATQVLLTQVCELRLRLEVVVLPGLRTAFSLVRHRVGGLVAVVTCRCFGGGRGRLRSWDCWHQRELTARRRVERSAGGGRPPPGGAGTVGNGNRT